MDIDEIVELIGRNWNVPWKTDQDRLEAAEDYRRALVGLNVDFDVLAGKILKEWAGRSHPKPPDLYKLAAGSFAKGSGNSVNKEYHQYIDRREDELIEAYEAENPDLWDEAKRDIWDHIMWSKLKDRAKTLARAEYMARHKAIPFDSPGNDISPDEIVNDFTLKLNPPHGDVDLWRKSRSPSRGPLALRIIRMAEKHGVDLYPKTNEIGA